jgi:hypothetical protein
MSISLSFPFTDSSNYTFGSSVQVTGGSASLKLIDNTGQTFNQPFDSDSGFTYDSALAEFTGGLVRQKDTRPTNATLYAGFPTDEDSSWADGSTNNSLSGGATWDAGTIDLTGRSGKKMTMPGSINFSTVSTAGCIRIKYIPDYTGTPAAIIQILEYATSGNRNAIFINHAVGGTFTIDLRDDAGAAHWLTTSSVSVTSGTPVILELDFDFDGTSRFFVDGISKGTLNTSSWTRAARSGTFHWGGQSGFGDHYMDDVILFSAVQHTSNHSGELPYTYYNNIYVGSKVELPQFSYSGVGAIQAFTSFATTDTNSPRYVMNDKYYSGGWVASDGSFAQASSEADVLANIATLPASDTLDIDIVFDDSNTLQMSVADLTTTYTGQIYSTANPTVECNADFRNEGMDSFTTTETAAGSDAVKYVLKKGTSWYYHNGSAWTTTDGTTYAESNTAAEIEAAKATFTTSAVVSKVKAFLHSADGSTSPEIDTITIQYDYSGSNPDDVDTCICWAYNKKGDGTIDTTPITATLTVPIAQYKTNTTITDETLRATPNSSTGYWELELVENANMDTGVKYEFEIGDKKYIRTVPDETTKNFWDLSE